MMFICVAVRLHDTIAIAINTIGTMSRNIFPMTQKIMFFPEKRKGCDDVATFFDIVSISILEIEVNFFGVE